MNVSVFLKQQHIEHEVLTHTRAYSAQRMAQLLHVPGREVAKTVLLRSSDGPYVLAVLPATKDVDFRKASRALGGIQVELASEVEIVECFPDCELGALPPFGSKYGMRTLVDREVANEKDILFEGNTLHESIAMQYADYDRLEQPLIADISR